MKTFDYVVALNQLAVGKETKLNSDIVYVRIPKWVRGADFLQAFLPYLKIVGDSREQDNWIERACKWYGIAFEKAKKDKTAQTENLKEGDYTFKVVFGDRQYDYTGKVAYERKGSVSELYGNCTGNKANGKSDRERIEREFNRFNEKEYQKVVMLLEFGEKLTDLIDMEFSYYKDGKKQTKCTYYTIYSALFSWKQPNNKGFEILQSGDHKKLFWLFLQDCFYFFRNEIRKECIAKKLIENIKEE